MPIKHRLPPSRRRKLVTSANGSFTPPAFLCFESLSEPCISDACGVGKGCVGKAPQCMPGDYYACGDGHCGDCDRYGSRELEVLRLMFRCSRWKLRDSNDMVRRNGSSPSSHPAMRPGSDTKSPDRIYKATRWSMDCLNLAVLFLFCLQKFFLGQTRCHLPGSGRSYSGYES